MAFPEYCILSKKDGKFWTFVQNKDGETREWSSEYRDIAWRAMHQYRRELKVEQDPDVQA